MLYLSTLFAVFGSLAILFTTALTLFIGYLIVWSIT